MIEFLRSDKFAVGVAIASVLLQTPHSYYVFQDVSNINNIFGQAQALLFAIVIDLSILFYTVRKNKMLARGGAVVMSILNIYYYYLSSGLGASFIFGIFLSLIIPISVYFYSEELETPQTKGARTRKKRKSKEESKPAPKLVSQMGMF
jgi:hypothetical protein